MEYSKSNILFLTVILITGILTIITDLKSKKIYNQHLILGTVLGVGVTIYSLVFAGENVLFHFINSLVAFVIGFCFYHFDLWRGGDAKLFILYAFLMPPIKGLSPVLSSTINLFTCTFTAGIVIFLPIFFKDFTANKNGEFFLENLKKPFNSTKLTILFSWMLYPVYYLAINYFAKIINTAIIFQLTTYIIFYITRRCLDKLMKINYITASLGIAFGFFMRLLLNPHSLSWPTLPHSILNIGLYSFLSSLIYATQTDFERYRDRVPFAPLLFIGCLLSYTPFLGWIKRFIT